MNQNRTNVRNLSQTSLSEEGLFPLVPCNSTNKHKFENRTFHKYFQFAKTK